MTGDSLLKSPKSDDIAILWSKFKDEGTIQIRNRIFEHYFPWCRDVARTLFVKYRHYLINWDDFISIISLSTLKCIETYDMNFGVPFEGYAYTRLKGSLLNEIKNNLKHNKQYDLTYVREENTDELEEKADEDSFLFIVDLVVEMAFTKLLEIGAQESNQPDYYYEKEQTASQLVKLVEQLEYQQKFIIKSHYFQQIPFKEIAGIMGLTNARVSQLHKSGLLALRATYESIY